VVKPLSGVLAHMPRIRGAAIMGNGKTVLVVNTERLLSLGNAHDNRTDDLHGALPR